MHYNNARIFDFTKNIRLRLVTLEDARFILSLRTNPHLNQHISAVDNDFLSQVNWLKDYKVRESQGDELYYVICSKDESVSYAVARVYDISQSEKTCKIGSWIQTPDAPRTTTIESMLTFYHGLFVALGIKTINIDVRKKNTNVIGIHKKFGAQFLKEDDQDIYFTVTNDDFDPIRQRYSRFFKPNVLLTVKKHCTQL